MKKSGSGDSVIKLPAGVAGAIVTARHSGSSNFTIEVLDATNSSTDLLVNTIGAYSGTTMIGAQSIGDEEASKLKVGADGAWSITVSPVSKAPLWRDSMSAKGDGVYLFEMAATDWLFTNNGDGNFAVISVGNGDGLLINEIGTYKGVVPVTEGPAVMVITSEGTWTAKRQ